MGAIGFWKVIFLSRFLSLRRSRTTALLTFFPILHILGAIYSDDGKEYAPLLTQRDAGRWKAFQSGAEGDPGAPGLNGK